MPLESRLTVVTPHPVIAAGLAAMLADEAWEVGSIETASKRADWEQWPREGVLVVDILLPGRDVFDRASQWLDATSDTRLFCLAPSDNPTWVARAVACGASDFLLRSLQKPDLVAALDRVRTGEPAPESGRMGRMKSEMERRSQLPPNPYGLTPREMQIARLLGLGLPNRDISRALKIRLETVKEHVQNLLRKTDAADRTEVAVRAIQRGWLT